MVKLEMGTQCSLETHANRLRPRFDSSITNILNKYLISSVDACFWLTTIPLFLWKICFLCNISISGKICHVDYSF